MKTVEPWRISVTGPEDRCPKCGDGDGFHNVRPRHIPAKETLIHISGLSDFTPERMRWKCRTCRYAVETEITG